MRATVAFAALGLLGLATCVLGVRWLLRLTQVARDGFHPFLYRTRHRLREPLTEAQKHFVKICRGEAVTLLMLTRMAP